MSLSEDRNVVLDILRRNPDGLHIYRLARTLEENGLLGIRERVEDIVYTLKGEGMLTYDTLLGTVRIVPHHQSDSKGR